MSKTKKKKAHEGRSAVLLAARLRSGAGRHNPKPTRAAEKRRAIKEHS